MKSDRRVPVAIIGGGASGTILAAQLARLGIGSILCDGSGRAGQGIAYSTREAAHLLNVPADAMSARPGDPGDFARWFERLGGEAGGFAQRRQFGAYLREILDQAVASGHCQVASSNAVAARRLDGGWQVELDDGSALTAAALALCTGNQRPDRLRAFGGTGERFIADPWGEEARQAVAKLVESGGDALLVGTSLTMVDLALSLDAAGHRGRMIAVSRRGQVPRSHSSVAAAAAEADDVPEGDLGALIRWLRRRSAEIGWRAAVDSIRPQSHRLWQALSLDHQRRFLRHARPWWSVHRHRIAPEVGAVIARLVAEDRLQIFAGRITSAQDTSDGLEVELRRRGSDRQQRMQVDYAFNCTGPLHAIDRTGDPLLRSLLDSGEVRAEPLGVGLAVDDFGRVGNQLWALGPLTKGRYWEVIAVPDIRDQAAAVADDIARELER